MSRLTVRFHVPLLMSCLPLLALSAQQKRAFEPGGPESLMLAGSVTQTRSEVKEVMTGFSFTTDSKGRVVNTGGDRSKETVQVPVYEVRLFVDETGAREALKPFAGEEFYRLQGDGKVQDAVRKGAFPKLLLLRFTAPQKARLVRENLATELRKYPGGTGGDAGRFTSFLRKDFEQGDEVEIRIAKEGTVMTTVKGEAQQEIVSPEFADALLCTWLLKSPSSVQHLRALIPAKPVS